MIAIAITTTMSMIIYVCSGNGSGRVLSPLLLQYIRKDSTIFSLGLVGAACARTRHNNFPIAHPICARMRNCEIHIIYRLRLAAHPTGFTHDRRKIDWSHGQGQTEVARRHVRDAANDGKLRWIPFFGKSNGERKYSSSTNTDRYEREKSLMDIQH